jgi:methenyltetrahydrofolate cyclohydrolase
MLIDQRVNELLAAIASDQPVPGGGSVSALVGALGANLAIMYANLSFNKSYYQALDETIKQQFRNAYNQLQEISQKLQQLVDDDAKAYQQVLDAYRLPKATEDEIRIRKTTIQLANQQAIATPYQTMNQALEGLKLLEFLLPYGNPNAISDLGVAAILLDSAIKGAKLNVMINLTEQDTELGNIITDMIQNSEELKQQILNKISL